VRKTTNTPLNVTSILNKVNTQRSKYQFGKNIVKMLRAFTRCFLPLTALTKTKYGKSRETAQETVNPTPRLISV
jgi:hypothetical protein